MSFGLFDRRFVIVPSVTKSSRLASWWLTIVAASLVALVVATPAAFRSGGDNVYISMAVATGLLALAATHFAERVPLARALWIIFAVAIGLRLFLLFVEPLLSTDIYRYVWDGRVQAHGINPYRYVPADPALAALRDTEIYPNINRADYAVTIYPPVAQIFFFLVTRLGETVTVMKAGFLACEAATVLFILLILKRLGKRPTAIVGYLWHPLPLWEVANNGHVDALMTALLMAGIWCALAGRVAIAFFVIGLSGLAKPTSYVSLPAIWRPWKIKAIAAALSAVAICYVPYLSMGWGVLGFLTRGYLTEETYVGGAQVWPLAMWRKVVGPLAFDYPVYLAIAALIMFTLALRSIRRPTMQPDVVLDDIKRLLLAFLLLLSANYPWYFLVLTPFVALSGGATVWAATLGAVLLHDELEWDFFIPLLDRKSALYGLVFAACVYEWWRSRRQSQVIGHERVVGR